jgi:hypothetical protein
MARDLSKLSKAGGLDSAPGLCHSMAWRPGQSERRGANPSDPSPGYCRPPGPGA